MRNDDKSELDQSPLLSPTTPHDENLRTSTLKDNDRGTERGTALALQHIPPKSTPTTPPNKETIQLMGNSDQINQQNNNVVLKKLQGLNLSYKYNS